MLHTSPNSEVPLLDEPNSEVPLQSDPYTEVPLLGDPNSDVLLYMVTLIPRSKYTRNKVPLCSYIYSTVYDMHVTCIKHVAWPASY